MHNIVHGSTIPKARKARKATNQLMNAHWLLRSEINQTDQHPLTKHSASAQSTRPNKIEHAQAEEHPLTKHRTSQPDQKSEISLYYYPLPTRKRCWAVSMFQSTYITCFTHTLAHSFFVSLLRVWASTHIYTAWLSLPTSRVFRATLEQWGRSRMAEYKSFHYLMHKTPEAQAVHIVTGIGILA